MHEYVKEWWENKASNNDDSVWNDSHNREIFEKYAKKGNWSKSVEEREDLKHCKNFAFVYPTIGRKKCLEKINIVANECAKTNNNSPKLRLKNLWIPEIVDIDYSDYEKEKKFKNVLTCKHFRDGILIINDPTKENKGIVFLEIADVVNENESPAGKSIINIFRESFSNFGQINWSDKKFDDKLVLYIVQPKISKTKAAKIVLKDNVYVNRLIKNLRKTDYSSGVFNPPKSFKDFFIKKTEHSLFLNDINTANDGIEREETINRLSQAYSKKDCMEISHSLELLTLYNLYHATSIDSKDRRFIGNKPLDKPGFFEELEKLNNFEIIKNFYFKEIFEHEKDLDIFDLVAIKEGDKFEKIISIYIKKILVKAALLNYCTNDGLSFVDGKEIDYNSKTKTNCLLFWKNISASELIMNVLNKNNFPIVMINSVIINNAEIDDPKVIEGMNISMNNEAVMEKASKYQRPFEFKNKHIIEEAMNSPLGYTMPYDGVFEILHDLVFSFIKFREYKDYITIVISDDNENYFFEVFDKKQKDFKYFLWNNLKLNDNYSEDCIQDIYTKLATCIRDAKVLIERDSTMQYRGRRSPSNCKTNSVYHIYFPKVRYRRSSDAAQVKKEKNFFNESRKFSGTRRAHIRRLVSDQKPSKKQLLLAKRLDIWIPDGHTFVRESEWGSNMTKREIRYRNTALNGVFYYDSRELSEAEKIDQLGPLGFEEYSRDYIKKMGYEVKSSQSYDGGIDIRAMRVLDNLDTEYLMVQCKNWKTPIPPNEMRAFKTACDEEHSEYKKVKMFITSSRFSPGAKELAHKHDIIMIDGDDLIQRRKNGR